LRAPEELRQHTTAFADTGVLPDAMREQLTATARLAPLARAGRSSVLRMARVESRTALLLGAAVGSALGATAAAKRAGRDGNTIAGEVAIHLLDRIELLTIQLEVQQVPKARALGSKRLSAGPDVHRNRDKARKQ
jgi:hypothetical protein